MGQVGLRRFRPHLPHNDKKLKETTDFGRQWGKWGLRARESYGGESTIFFFDSHR